MQKTLLMIEKSEFMSKIVALMLEGLPYRVVYASTLQGGLEKAEGEVSTLLIDVRLLDGKELPATLSELHAIPPLKRTRVVITHTKALPLDYQETALSHNASTLRKPFTQEKLKEAIEIPFIEELMEHSSLQDEVQAFFPSAGAPILSPAAIEQIVREVSQEVVKEISRDIVASIAPQILKEAVKELLTTPPVKAPLSPTSREKLKL
ncbi:MAG: hypothetical protein HY391_00775 [Deltaproteobacteria bacterium]|nr:hypothetical protein [Deltaproteobacteria bacterium]